MAKPEQVQDEGFRTLLLQARSAFLDRKGTASVHSSVEALLRLMQQQPDLIQLKRAPGVAVRVDWRGCGDYLRRSPGADQSALLVIYAVADGNCDKRYLPRCRVAAE